MAKAKRAPLDADFDLAVRLVNERIDDAANHCAQWSFNIEQNPSNRRMLELHQRRLRAWELVRRILAP